MKGTIFKVLTLPRFSAYISCQVLSQVGNWAQQVTISWLAWELTQSTTWLGFLAMCQLLPYLLVLPFSGVWIDRISYLTIAIIALALGATQAIILFGMSLANQINIYVLIVSALFLGLTDSLAGPSIRMVVKNLVHKSHLPAAISINSAFSNVARFLGPVVAGVFLVNNLDHVTFIFNFTTYIIIIVLLYMFLKRKILTRNPIIIPKQEFTKDLLEGFRYCWRSGYARLILGCYLAFALLGRPVADLMPAIVAQLPDGDAGTLALFTSAVGATAIPIGLLIGGVLERVHQELILRGAILTMVAGLILLVISSTVGGMLAGVIAYGAAQAAVGITTQTLLQLYTPEHLGGRIMALHVMMFRLGAAVGPLLIGGVAEWIGLSNAFLIAALCLGCIFIVAFCYRPNPQV